MSQPMPYPPAFPPVPPPARGRWMAPVALLLSLLAAVAGVWALLRPVPQPPGNPAVADPKTQACAAFNLVTKGVDLQSRKELGPEAVALETVAANTRLAMVGGASYLRDNVPSNTPAELAEPLRKLADQLQVASQYFFVGQTSKDVEQASRLSDITDTTNQIAGICKAT